jgi:hypothetical protein
MDSDGCWGPKAACWVLVQYTDNCTHPHYVYTTHTFLYPDSEVYMCEYNRKGTDDMFTSI